MKRYPRTALVVVVVALLLGTAFASVASAAGPYWYPGGGYQPVYWPGYWGGYQPYPYPTYWGGYYPNNCGGCYQYPYHNTYWYGYGWNTPYNAWYPQYGYQYPYNAGYWNGGWNGYRPW